MNKATEGTLLYCFSPNCCDSITLRSLKLQNGYAKRICCGFFGIAEELGETNQCSCAQLNTSTFTVSRHSKTPSKSCGRPITTDYTDIFPPHYPIRRIRPTPLPVTMPFANSPQLHPKCLLSQTDTGHRFSVKSLFGKEKASAQPYSPRAQHPRKFHSRICAPHGQAFGHFGMM
jgi:hypothetical protein